VDIGSTSKERRKEKEKRIGFIFRGT